MILVSVHQSSPLVQSSDCRRPKIYTCCPKLMHSLQRLQCEHLKYHTFPPLCILIMHLLLQLIAQRSLHKICGCSEFDYSKTSNNGPFEKRTISVQRTDHLPPVDFTTELIHFEPPRSRHLSTPNNGHLSVPNIPQPIPLKMDSEDNVDACRPLSLRHCCLIQRPNTIVALLRIVLAFLVSGKQRRGPKRQPHCVRQSQITMPTGSVPNAYNGYLRISDLQQWSHIILMILVLLLPSCY